MGTSHQRIDAKLKNYTITFRCTWPDGYKTFPEDERLEIYGLCIMPGHIHIFIGSKKNKDEDIVRDTISFTSC